MVKVVMVAVSDDRAASDAAFEHGVTNEVGPDSELIIVYARPTRETDVQFKHPNQVIHYKTYTQPVEEMYNKRSQEVLSRYAELARQAKVNFQALELEGSFDEAISAKCRAVEADLLIVGSSERSLLTRLAMGDGVKKLIARTTNCPVLVVKPKSQEISRSTVRRVQGVEDYHLLAGEEGQQ